MSKTNAVRILEAGSISHKTVSYEVDENDLNGIVIANKIGADAEKVFKTLVAYGDKNGINIFCIPVTSELNLKKAATASNNKKIEMIKVKDLFPVTGYIQGGCSPIGMKKNFQTYIEENALIFDNIYASAGIRGMQIFISPDNLQQITNAVFTDLV
jgi:Cys-tRNA(Pro)/Cys-tRNA(Cys) deacylase